MRRRRPTLTGARADRRDFDHPPKLEPVFGPGEAQGGLAVSELAADCAVYVLNEPSTMIEEANQKDFAPISRSEAGCGEFIPSGRFNPRM